MPESDDYNLGHFNEGLPFLDEVNPPAFGKVKMLTLGELCQLYGDGETERLHAAVRRALCFDEDTVLDEDDSSLTLQAWEARNNTLVTRLVLYIADSCPKLEEFE